MTENGRGRAAGITVQLLGPVRAWVGTREIDLGPSRRRSLLAILAMSAGQPVSLTEIIDDLWPDSPPGHPAASVYTYVNGLRRAFDPERDSRSSSSVVESASPGYRLRGDDVEVDAARFTGHVNAGRALLVSDPRAALVEFDAAVGLWRGVPLTDVNGPFAQTARLRLMEQRFGLAEDRARALLTLGDHSAAIATLRGPVDDYPLRERTRGLLMQALYRGGRIEEALAVFADVRAVLNSELGIDPSPFLRRLRDRIDERDPALLGDLVWESGQAAPEVPTQLPPAVSTFTGRNDELERLRSLLVPAVSADGPPIGVISGPAGVGKTSLAVRIAHELSGYFPDGQLFLNLRGFDPHKPAVNAVHALSNLLGELGSQANIPGGGEAELAGQFRSTLAGKRVLIVLDNALSSEQVRSLLPGSSCAVLITSRNRLAGLVARDGAHVLNLDPLLPEESRAFLTRLAGEARTAEATEDLGRIAELCGHLPLALGIVARRLAAQPALRPSAVVAELSGTGDRLDALASDGADGEAIRSVFSWSYQALKPEPAQMFRLLGLYPGNRISTGAAGALNGTSEAEARRLLDALANSHLLEWAGRGHYQIHDLLHLYTRRLIDEEATGGERRAAGRRLFDWYLYSASNANRALDPNQGKRRLTLEPPPERCRPLEFSDGGAASEWLTTEADSLVSVVRYAVEFGYDEYVWKIVSTVSKLVQYGPQINDWIELTRLAVAAAERQGDRYAQMWSTNALGYIYMHAGRIDEAMECFTACLQYWRTSGAAQPGARLLEEAALSGSAHVYRLKGELGKALEYCNQALPISVEEGDAGTVVWTLNVLGRLYCDQGRFAEAEATLRDALTKRPASGWTPLLLDHYLFSSLGEVELRLGRLEEAVVYLNQALNLVRILRNPLSEVRVLHFLSQVHHDLGQIAEANMCKRLAGELIEKFSLPTAAVQI